MEKIEFTRQELYEMVWNTPLSRLAKKYAISDNGLRKICKKLNIPLPDNGYWVKLKYHKSVRKKSLPQDVSVDKKEILLSEKDLDIPSPNSIQKELVRNYLNLNSEIFKVPQKLVNPDKLIIEKQSALIASRSRDYSYPFKRVYTLDIIVGKDNEARALRIFDTLIKILKFRNHDIIINGDTTYAIVYGGRFKISMREKQRIEKIVEHNWNTNRYYPTGKLCFRFDYFHKREFLDDKVLLENKLPAILAHIEYRGQLEKEEREERAIRMAMIKEKERIEKEKKERKEKEIQDFKNLIKESNSWHQSIILENYVKAIENNAIETNKLSEELKQWLVWAKQKAEWYNPFIKKDDAILSNDDRLLF